MTRYSSSSVTRQVHLRLLLNLSLIQDADPIFVVLPVKCIMCSSGCGNRLHTHFYC